MSHGAVQGGLGAFLQLRSEIECAGWTEDVPSRLASGLDDAVRSLVFGKPPRGWILLATGGYGRSRMCLRSDVDLTIVHSGTVDPGLPPAVWRPVWDAGLKLGHAVLTVDEVAQLAYDRLDAFCTYVTARPLAGDRSVWAAVERKMAELSRLHPHRVLDGLQAEEARRRAEVPAGLMSTDLKNGRGGLRSLDMIEWRRRVLGLTGVDPGSVRPVETEARGVILAARCALHAVVGRLHDRYDVELRGAAASWLGTTQKDLGRRVLWATRTVEHLVSDAWPALRRVGPGRPAPRSTASEPVLRVAQRAGGRQGIVFSPADEERIRQAGPPARWTEEDRRALLDLTRPGPSRVVWQRLVDLGWIGRAIPEWEEMVDAAHVVPFHRFGVHEHSLRTVDEMRLLLDESAATGLSSEVVRRLERHDTLLWGALFHDLGKPADGDHSREGSKRVRAVMERMSFDPVAVSSVERFVRHHLLLPDLATRFDVDDPRVVTEAAGRIGNVEMLRGLYLLAIADSRATGTDTWTEWKAELMRRAFRRLEREFVRQALPMPVQIRSLVERVLAAGAHGIDPSAIETHLERMSPDYRATVAPARIAEHVRLGMEETGVVVEARAAGAVARVHVIASDRPGLLAAITAGFTANRLSVVDAACWTSERRTAFDTFEVVDAFDGEVPSSERLAEAERTLVGVIQGEVDPWPIIEQRRRSYGVRLPDQPVAVEISDDTASGWVIEVRAPDRVGLLADVAAALQEHGVHVRRARFDTRGGVAIDVFVVAAPPEDGIALAQALRAAAAG